MLLDFFFPDLKRMFKIHLDDDSNVKFKTFLSHCLFSPHSHLQVFISVFLYVCDWISITYRLLISHCTGAPVYKQR